jgi:hydrogenase maturation protease
MTASSGATSVVIGVGNDFRHDDGVGQAVVAALRDTGGLPGRVRLACCDGEPTRLIELWHDARLAIVVDAAVADPVNGPLPGDVLRWEVDCSVPDAEPSEVVRRGPGYSMPGWAVRSEPAGTHSLGPGAAFQLARVLDRLPERLVILAVVGTDFGAGPGLSTPAAEAVNRVVAEIRDEFGRQGRSALPNQDHRPCPGSAPPGRLRP